jgi:hypothetical protein
MTPVGVFAFASERSCLTSLSLHGRELKHESPKRFFKWFVEIAFTMAALFRLHQWQVGGAMTPHDPMAVAVNWLDAYRAARINQIVGMYSPDAVIECRLWGRRIGHEGIAAYWRERFVESPALDLEELQVDGGAVVVSYRTSRGNCSGAA